MSAALVTGTLLGLAGMLYAAVVGYTADASADIFLHTSFGIFSTFLILLTHSMTMFYLIGKGKAVREAVAEGNLPQELYARVARARKPVFSIATIAMLLAMLTAIIGGGVDTGVLPVGIHTLFAFSTILANGVALRTEVAAMMSSTQVVEEVNELLASQS